MSTRELRRAEVLAASEERDAAAGRRSQMLEVSYRQAKRLWPAISRRRSQRTPAPQRRKRLESGEAREIRRKVLQLIREK